MECETMNKIVIAAGLLAAATTGAWAQDYYPPNIYGYGNATAPGYYDYAPGYAYEPGFSPYSYGGDWYDYDRVDQPGRGNSVESTR